MRIKWYGTASLLVEGGGTRILIDPYLKKFNQKLPPVPVDEALTADAVFITHPHFDHFSDIAEFSGGNVKNIYVSENGIRSAKDSGIEEDIFSPLVAGQTVTVGDITVRTFKSRHCRFDLWTVLGVVLKPATYLHPGKTVSLLKAVKKYKMRGDIYALELSCGGKSVMVLGSSGMDKDTEYPQGADLMVFPYQGRTRMHKYMKPFLHTFRPKAVMADHFDNAFPPLTHTVSTKKFVAAVKEVLPQAVAFVPLENEWYEI